MTYREAIDYLYGIRMFGQRLGLETVAELLRRMGNPQTGLEFIHIAGTNGKGSVAALCQSVLTVAGQRTGLYTSPHLVSFCERMQVEGEPIAEAGVVRLVEQVRPLLEQMGADAAWQPPTFFEVVTAMALQYFREQQVRMVVWETGLGGRLDATNVVIPRVSVITSIAREHTQYLGDTLEAIAAEKCGIIKPGVPVVTSAGSEEALAVIRRVCAERGSRLTVIGEGVRAQRGAETDGGQQVRLSGTRAHDGLFELPLLGAHQAVNCATAVAAIEAAGLAVSAAQMREGVSRTRWPGRFQIVGRDPTVVVDGAHNPAGVEQLAGALREHFGERRLVLVLGILKDKEYEVMCRRLAPLAARVWCVPVQSERSSDPEVLARLCRESNPGAEVRVGRSVMEAMAQAGAAADEVVLITGSLFVVGEALQRLQPPFGRQAVNPTEMILQ